MTNDQKLFIERIQNLRRSLELSSKQMASLFGIDYQTYDYWEAGLRRPGKIVNRFMDLVEMIRVLHPDTFEKFKKATLGNKK